MEVITSTFGAETTAREIASRHDLSGRRAIVTGGASGIGFETVRALVEAGADVMVAARDLNQARDACGRIGEIGRNRVKPGSLDLASFGSIKAFAEEWGAQPLHILINNAGVMASPLSNTENDLELQIGTNHFGHYLLTRLLSDRLKDGAEKTGTCSRVVSVSSAAHRMSDINWGDMHFRNRPYDPWISYGQSKTANILFAVEFDRLHAAEGIRAYSVMPGIILTPLMRHMTPQDKHRMGLTDEAGKPISRLPLKTTEQGAATSIWAAVANELEHAGGIYLQDCQQILPNVQYPAGALMSYAVDNEAASRLWHLSEAITPSAN